MANDIKHLAEQILKSIKSSSVIRKTVTNTASQVFYIKYTEIVKQVEYSLGVENVAEINSACKKFFSSLPKLFPESSQDSNSRFYKIEYLRVNNNIFSIKITGPTATSNINKWLSSKLAPLKNTLYNDIKKYINKDVSKKDFLNKSGKNSYDKGFELIRALNEFFDVRPKFNTVQNEIIIDLRKNIQRKFHLLESKNTINTLLSGKILRSKSDLAIEQQVIKEIFKTLDTKDFAINELTPLVKRELLGEMYKMNLGQIAKFKKDIFYSDKARVEAYKASHKFATKEEIKEYKAKLKKGKIRSVREANETSLHNIFRVLQLSLPYLVEQKMGHLPPKAIKDPTKPLNYQSGRFAQSVRPVSVNNDTKPDVVTIKYTYQTDPYNYYEHSNISQSARVRDGEISRNNFSPSQRRDPRYIIEKSIREIAKQMIRAKFQLERVES